MRRKIAIEATRLRQVQMRRLDSLERLKSELDASTESLELVTVTITVAVGTAVATAVFSGAVVVIVMRAVVELLEAAVPDKLYAGSVHWLQNPNSMLMAVTRSGPSVSCEQQSVTHRVT